MPGISQYHVRLAQTDEEREAIYRFRYRINMEEKKMDCLSADHARKMLYDKSDFYSALYYVSHRGRLISSARVTRGTDGPFLHCEKEFFRIHDFEKHFAHEELAVVNHLAVDSCYAAVSVIQKTLMTACMEGMAAGAKIFFVSSDEWLLKKYESFGARIYKHPVQSEMKNQLYRMVLFLRDYEYLNKLKSPLLACLEKSCDDGGEDVRKVKELLGYRLSTGITPLSFYSEMKRLLYNIMLWRKALLHGAAFRTDG